MDVNLLSKLGRCQCSGADRIERRKGAEQGAGVDRADDSVRDVRGSARGEPGIHG